MKYRLQYDPSAPSLDIINERGEAVVFMNLQYRNLNDAHKKLSANLKELNERREKLMAWIKCSERLPAFLNTDVFGETFSEDYFVCWDDGVTRRLKKAVYVKRHELTPENEGLPDFYWYDYRGAFEDGDEDRCILKVEHVTHWLEELELPPSLGFENDKEGIED